jgi:hypothetical protein
MRVARVPFLLALTDGPHALVTAQMPNRSAADAGGVRFPPVTRTGYFPTVKRSLGVLCQNAR